MDENPKLSKAGFSETNKMGSTSQSRDDYNEYEFWTTETEESDPNVSFMFHNLILFNFFLSFSFSQYSTQFHHHQQNTVHPIPK